MVDVETIQTEESQQRKRNVAYKLRIGDILKAKPIMSEGSPENPARLLFLESGSKKIVRVNLIANCVEKFIQDAEKKYASLTLDDASGQIRIKTFGDDIKLLKDISQGDTLQTIGNVREFNSEIYILPEIVKAVDAKWLLVRKLEIQNARRDMPLPGNASLRDILLEKIKQSEPNSGIDIDQIIMEIEANPDLINAEIKKLIEEGLIYEPRPGRLRYLG